MQQRIAIGEGTITITWQYLRDFNYNINSNGRREYINISRKSCQRMARSDFPEIRIQLQNLWAHARSRRDSMFNQGNVN